MKNAIKPLLGTALTLLLTIPTAGCLSGNGQPQTNGIIEIETLSQLAEYAGLDSVEVRMAPGQYTLSDDRLTQQLVLQKARGNAFVDYPVAALIHFSGTHSTYHLDGVEILIDGKMHRAYPRPHLFEVFVSGSGNRIEGLKVSDLGDVVPVKSAIMMHVAGKGNVLSDVELFIRGSYPYGYGHLLGKSAEALVTTHKHTSLLVTGENTTLEGCRVITHAFGHGIVMQGAVNTTLKNCCVEGEMRSTDEMLKETSGPAFDLGFRSDYPPGVIVAGEMKSLSEDGIRSYPDGYNGRKTRGTTVIGCTVKHMRSGFDLSAQQGPVLISDCTAAGCQEKGYSLPSGGVIEKSRGDAMYGPLITFITRDIRDCRVELELMPNLSAYPPARLAEINGSGHTIRLTNHRGLQRTEATPIVFGESFWADVNHYRNPEKPIENWSDARDISLDNRTGMPIVLTCFCHDCTITTDGSISDRGTGNSALKK